MKKEDIVSIPKSTLPTKILINYFFAVIFSLCDKSQNMSLQIATKTSVPFYFPCLSLIVL